MPQYYPLVHTTFWLEYRLWGLHPLGYHLVNVLLHALAAIAAVARAEAFAGAGRVAGGGDFCLASGAGGIGGLDHRTQERAVGRLLLYGGAGVSAFCGAGMAVFPDRGAGPFVSGGVGFVCGGAVEQNRDLFAAGGAVAGALVETGPPLQRRDILPLLPFFAVGAALGLLTAWVEKHYVGAQGADWSLTLVDRCLVAGRALWFYAGKLAWPARLTFIYPRWANQCRHLVAMGVSGGGGGRGGGAWLSRSRIGQGPLVAVLFFAGTLGPALGFVNVFPMRYSFVADHFQYLASLGMIAWRQRGVALWLGRRQRRGLPGHCRVVPGAAGDTGLFNLATMRHVCQPRNVVADDHH